jgi:hypothetical protein
VFVNFAIGSLLAGFLPTLFSSIDMNIPDRSAKVKQTQHD